jgi:hypothetical protein
MSDLPSYARRVWAKARSETTRFIQHKLLTGACVAISVILVRVALWHYHRLPLTWADVWITLLTIVGSYGIVVLGAFVVNLFRAPGLLDNERAYEIAALSNNLRRKTEDNSVLAEKLQTINRQKEIRVTFAKLMEEGKDLEDQMRVIQDNAEFNNSMVLRVTDWVKRTTLAFRNFDMQTHATAFIQSGERLSDQQVSAVAVNFAHAWKTYPMAQLAVYRAKLQEIVERNNL